MSGLLERVRRGCQFANELAILGNLGNLFRFLELIIINKVDFHRLHGVANSGNFRVVTIFQILFCVCTPAEHHNS